MRFGRTTKGLSKYGNKKVEVDGVVFHSKRESYRWVSLKAMQSAGIIFNLERQVKYEILVNGFKICSYFADFKYRRNGKWYLEDVKGVKTPVYKLKKKLMLAVHGISIVEV